MSLNITQFETREQYLKERINLHLSKLTGETFDYYSKLNKGDIVELKTVLNDINNLLTFKMTIVAMEWIGEFFNLDEEILEKNRAKIDKVKPNSKGYDINAIGPYKILGEVKCVSPVNEGDRYGAAQHDSIMKDIGRLIDGKGGIFDSSNYYKFLFLMDQGDRTDRAINELLRSTNGKSPTAEKFNYLKNHHLIQLLNTNKVSDLDFSKVYVKKI